MRLVRSASRTHTCGLVPPGSLAGVPTCRPGSTPWSPPPLGLRLLLGLPTGVQVACPAGVRSVMGYSWTRQLPDAGPCRPACRLRVRRRQAAGAATTRRWPTVILAGPPLPSSV